MERPHLVLYCLSYELGNVCHTGAYSSTMSTMGGNRAEREKKRRKGQTYPLVVFLCIILSFNKLTSSQLKRFPSRPLTNLRYCPSNLHLAKLHLNSSRLITHRILLPFRSTSLLDTVPNEIALEIFKYLDPCTSTCLGLTCKKFYAIHTEIHGKASMFYRVQLDGGEYLYLFELLHGWMNTGKPCYDIYMPIWNEKIEKGLRGNTILAHQCTEAYKKILHFKGCWFCKMVARGTRVCAGKPSPTIGLYAYDRLVCVYPGKLCYTPDKEHHRHEFADVKAQLPRGGFSHISDINVSFFDASFGLLISCFTLWIISLHFSGY